MVNDITQIQTLIRVLGPNYHLANPNHDFVGIVAMQDVVIGQLRNGHMHLLGTQCRRLARIIVKQAQDIARMTGIVRRTIDMKQMPAMRNLDAEASFDLLQVDIVFPAEPGEPPVVLWSEF